MLTDGPAATDGHPPCDFLVFQDHGFDPAWALLPTAGGPDSDLSAETAATLHGEFDAELTLLHVTDEDEPAGVDLLADWGEEDGLSDAKFPVETRDVETAIADAAKAGPWR